jgi:hypothetical protein
MSQVGEKEGEEGNKGKVEERREADELNGREDEERRVDGRESGNENVR